MSSSTRCEGTRHEEDSRLQELKKKKKTSIKALKKIYDEQGPNSEEFYHAIKNLINYLQYQYMGKIDEDCFNDCYVRILESFDYWNPEKSNIISWIHLVVRNKVSSFCYTTKKIQRESYEYNDVITQAKETNEIAIKDTIRSQISSMVNVNISTNDKEDLVDFLFFSREHPLYKSIIWDNETEESESWKNHGKKLNIAIQ